MKVVSVIEFMNGEGPLCECTTGSVAFVYKTTILELSVF